jgi:hypothetical protein
MNQVRQRLERAIFQMAMELPAYHQLVLTETV